VFDARVVWRLGSEPGLNVTLTSASGTWSATVSRAQLDACLASTTPGALPVDIPLRVTFERTRLIVEVNRQRVWCESVARDAIEAGQLTAPVTLSLQGVDVAARFNVDDVLVKAVRSAGGGAVARSTSPASAKPASAPTWPKASLSRGTVATKAAILEGLKWLLRHQNSDGSWTANSLDDACTSGSPCWLPTLNTDGKAINRTGHYDEGITGLALLAFFGAGYGPDSLEELVDTQRNNTYVVGERVKNGLQWLCDRQNEDGSFLDQSENPKHTVYNEAIGSIALTNAYGLTRDDRWRGPAQQALEFLFAAQKLNPNGDGYWGWRYQARKTIEERKQRGEIDDKEYAELIFDSDTSVTTWCVKALRTAQLAGLDVPAEAMNGANAFIRFVTPRDNSGKVGYLDAAAAGQTVMGTRDMFTYYPETMSSLGICSRISILHDYSDPFLRGAADLIAKKPPSSKDKLAIDYYYWHHGTLALNLYDGPESPNRGRGGYWKKWEKAMTEALSSLQDQTDEEDVCRKGGWLTLDRWAYTGGPIYTTAINILTLEAAAGSALR
jgi:hypothetical protein